MFIVDRGYKGKDTAHNSVALTIAIDTLIHFNKIYPALVSIVGRVDRGIYMAYKSVTLP